MPSPKVSIIMPVYNTSAYLREAIQSILSQTFIDFEYIIINDGSTDQSEHIILSFTDPRIRYFKNEKNEGLVYTLNRGIDLATSPWIARMDGDDISLPARLEKQWNYLESHGDAEVLATTVILINENGEITGSWKDDIAAITPKEIRAYLPRNNCIAHPSVMIKAALLKKYHYSSLQSQAEDYDLWLRLMCDGINIHKLNEPLVKHRILSTSFTRRQQKNVFQKLAITKYRFSISAFRNGKFNAFVLNTFLNSGMDAMKGWIKNIREN